MIDQSDVLKRNNVTIRGNGRQPIVFAHGYGCDHYMWRFVYPAFLDDYKVILFDHVGSGNSDEAYYDEDEIEEINGKKTSKTSGSSVDWVEEESYFFRLSAWSEKLLKYYKDNEDFIFNSRKHIRIRVCIKFRFSSKGILSLFFYHLCE